MQFGRTELSALDTIDFKLPAEPVFNQAVLKGEPAAKIAFYVGCTSWNRKEWVGSVFPKGTKEKDFLPQYARSYNSVELNATHYKIYPPATIRKWAEQTAGKDFQYCPKVPQQISHHSSLVNMPDTTAAFLEAVAAFGEQLGPIFLQLNEQFSPARKEQLYNYLASLPADMRFFVEVRHPDWFQEPGLFEALRGLGAGAVITDTASRRDCVHMHLPLSTAFIRFVGNSLHPTDYVRIDDWVNRFRYWFDNGLEKVYFFLHMHDEIAEPDLSIYLAEKLETVCGIKIPRPVIFRDNTLF